jgi:hypothetical protein
MRKILNVLLIVALITSMIVPSMIEASETNTTTEEITVKKKLKVINFDTPNGISMLQGENMIGDLPGIPIIDENGEQAKGTFTYPNYDNMRLGTWDLEWVFTPDDPAYETVTGTIKLNVRARDPEPIEEVTTPSLTATTVLLDTMTTYDINLDNKVTGSSYLWTSSDTAIIEVNSKSGLLKAKSTGKANVTCKITLPDATTQTLVSEVIVGIDDNAPLLTETTLDLDTGNVFDINLENKVTKSKYRWVSSNRAVATVNSSNGKVTAIGSGSAYVTCTITTPTNQVIVLRCDINVTTPEVVTE